MGDGLCVKEAHDGTLRVVHGGTYYPNPVEVALKNLELSGDASYVDRLDPDLPGWAVKRSMSSIYDEGGSGLFIDPMLAYWAAVAFTKVIGAAAEDASGALTAVTSIKNRLPGGTGKQYDKKSGRGVYVLYDENGTVRYVGQGDAYGRVQDHSRHPKKGELAALIVAPNNLTKAEARGLEQLLIEHYGGAKGPQLWNNKNGTGPRNLNRNRYLNAGRPLFQEALQIIDAGVGK